MEKFRRKLQIRRLLLILLALFVVAVCVFDVFFKREPVDGSFYEGFVQGFTIGGSVGTGLIAVFSLVRLSLILKDETKLRQQFNLENDERLKAIRAKSGMPMLIFTSLAMVIAGMIAGFFNETVCLTLIIAAACQLLAGVAVKAVHMKIM